MTFQEAMNSEEIAKKMENISSMTEAVNILAGYGIETTEEELVAMLPTEEGELTDENLEGVSGGLWIGNLPLVAFTLLKLLRRQGHSSGGGRHV